MLESSLRAPKAALAALATAIPPPIQERPVTRAAARYPRPVARPAEDAAAVSAEHHRHGDEQGSKEEYRVDAQRPFITFFTFLSQIKITKRKNNT